MSLSYQEMGALLYRDDNKKVDFRTGFVRCFCREVDGAGSSYGILCRFPCERYHH